MIDNISADKQCFKKMESTVSSFKIHLSMPVKLF